MIIDVLTVLLTLVMSVGRLLSGVHWLTDVIGGVLISLFLISLYVTALSILDTKKTDR
jgi:undecaprenyl-diphosphatase